MKDLTIEQFVRENHWRLEHIDNTLRMCYNALNGITALTPEGHKGRAETCLDREIKKSKGFLAYVLDTLNTALYTREDVERLLKEQRDICHEVARALIDENWVDCPEQIMLNIEHQCILLNCPLPSFTKEQIVDEVTRNPRMSDFKTE